MVGSRAFHIGISAVQVLTEQTDQKRDENNGSYNNIGAVPLFYEGKEEESHPRDGSEHQKKYPKLDDATAPDGKSIDHDPVHISKVGRLP